MYIDAHTHFNIILGDGGTNEEQLINNCVRSRLSHAVQIAISEETLQWSYDFSLRHNTSGILFSLGIHPSSQAGNRQLKSLDIMIEKALRDHPELLFGIGECGLDYFRMKQSKEMQKLSFRHQILCAKKHNLPLIIHTRDAMPDTLQMIRELSPVRGIMHCFQGGKKEAAQALELGMMISFAGNLTYKKAYELHESAAYVPLDRVLLETDAPFLTPVPLRGKRNRPEYVVHTYRVMAELRKMPVEALAEQVSQNFLRLAQRTYLREK